MSKSFDEWCSEEQLCVIAGNAVEQAWNAGQQAMLDDVIEIVKTSTCRQKIIERLDRKYGVSDDR